MTTYTIPANVVACRSTQYHPELGPTPSETSAWDWFITSRPVTYTDADCIIVVQRSHLDTRWKDWYLFRLPEAALPYRFFAVFRSRVEVHQTDLLLKDRTAEWAHKVVAQWDRLGLLLAD